MADQINTPKDWRLLAEDDLSVAEYLAANMRPRYMSYSGSYKNYQGFFTKRSP